MTYRRWQKGLIGGFGAGLAILLSFGLLIRLFAFSLTPNWEMISVFILLATAIFFAYHLVSFCAEWFRCSDEIIVKTFAITIAIFTGITTFFGVLTILVWFLLFSSLFCRALGQEIINFPQYLKAIHIVDGCSLYGGDFKIVYVREGLLPIMQEIGSTPRSFRHSSSIERSEIVHKGDLLEFGYLEVRGGSA